MVPEHVSMDMFPRHGVTDLSRLADQMMMKKKMMTMNMCTSPFHQEACLMPKAGGGAQKTPWPHRAQCFAKMKTIERNMKMCC